MWPLGVHSFFGRDQQKSRSVERLFCFADSAPYTNGEFRGTRAIA
jgi:hypothetical protein